MVQGGALAILPKPSGGLILRDPTAHHGVQIPTLLAIMTEYPTTGLGVLGLPPVWRLPLRARYPSGAELLLEDLVLLLLDGLDIRLLAFGLFLEMRRALLGPTELPDKSLIFQGALGNSLTDTHLLVQATI